MARLWQVDEVIDNEVCTFDYAVEDREATASSFGVDFALRFSEIF
jgi:hypothetical protein